ncbi:MAG: hypothetical protein AAGG65_01405 [Pseudomonadota bacterium]
MKCKLATLTVAMSASLMLVSPAMSQVVDYDDVEATCVAGGDCESLVLTAIEQIAGTYASQPEFEEHVGLLAGALAVRSERLPMVHWFNLAGGLRAIAA